MNPQPITTENTREDIDLVEEIDAETLKAWLRADRAVLIDVREHEEYEEEHIPGATLMPLSSFAAANLPDDWRGKIPVLHCLVGSRSAKAGRVLLDAGVPEVAQLKDGILGWVAAGGETRSIA